MLEKLGLVLGDVPGGRPITTIESATCRMESVSGIPEGVVVPYPSISLNKELLAKGFYRACEFSKEEWYSSDEKGQYIYFPEKTQEHLLNSGKGAEAEKRASVVVIVDNELDCCALVKEDIPCIADQGLSGWQARTFS